MMPKVWSISIYRRTTLKYCRMVAYLVYFAQSSSNPLAWLQLWPHLASNQSADGTVICAVKVHVHVQLLPYSLQPTPSKIKISTVFAPVMDRCSYILPELFLRPLAGNLTLGYFAQKVCAISPHKFDTFHQGLAGCQSSVLPLFPFFQSFPWGFLFLLDLRLKAFLPRKFSISLLHFIKGWLPTNHLSCPTPSPTILPEFSWGLLVFTRPDWKIFCPGSLRMGLMNFVKSWLPTNHLSWRKRGIPSTSKTLFT